jgi:hypothetical protein
MVRIRIQRLFTAAILVLSMTEVKEVTRILKQNINHKCLNTKSSGKYR